MVSTPTRVLTATNLVFAVAVIVLAVLYARLRARTSNSVMLPEHASVTPQPGNSASVSLPANMTTVSLAYYLTANQGVAGRALYLEPFKAAFTHDGLVPVPAYDADVDKLLQACTRAYGVDGEVVAEAAIIAYMNKSQKDLAA